ncbi:MAG: PAS domain-containing protein [Nitrososphaerales archaeon]
MKYDPSESSQPPFHTDRPSSADEIAEAARFPTENPNPVFRVAGDGRLLYANPASQLLLAAWCVADKGCVPPAWRERVARVLLARETCKWDEECGGRVLQLTCVPIEGAGYVNVYGADITERVALETQLREVEARANDLIRYAPTGIYEVDFRTGRFRSVNDAMCEILGYTRDELVAMSASDLLDDEGKARFADRMRRTLAGERVDPSVEYRVIKKDGSAIYGVLSTRITHHDGQPDGAFVIAHDVTERRRASDELARQRGQLREANTQAEALAERLADQDRFVTAVLESIPVQIAYLDEHLTYRLCNQAAAAEMGQPVEGILGRPLRDLNPENPQVSAAIEGVLRTGEPFRSEEFPVTWPDRPEEGTQYYTVAYLPDKDASGRVRGVFAEGQRVTALVEARQQLQAARDELEQRVHERTAELEAIFASVPDALYVANEHGIARANQAALQSFGVDCLEELQARPGNLAETMQARAVDTGKPVPPQALAIARALAGERAVHEVISRNPRTNQDQIHRIAAAPIVVDGRSVGAVGIATDITEQKRREAQLAYQAMLLENVNDAIFAYDSDLRITAWNKRAEEQYGWQAEEVLGAYAPDVVGSRMTQEQRAAAMHELSETGRWQGELDHARRDGTPIIVEATAMRLCDESGRVLGFVTVNRDITRRKKTEDELRASREQLRTLSRRLVAAQEAERRYVADQLYNQAGQVLAALQLQLSRLGREEGLRSPAALLPAMQAMVNEAMRELHDLALQLRPVGLDRSALAGVLSTYLKEFGKRHGLRVQFDAGGAEDLRLPADIATAVYRAVQEGLTNVAGHAQASEVSLSLDLDGDRLTIALADNGVGFASARGAGASGSPGTGLGLAGIRERLEAVGGQFAVESGAGGTTLYMQAPLSREEQPA